ncbi:ATP-binding cassette domain-containing protein [Clostridium neuense]|uniref:ATP-binding cassette domain-containing protein n=1 Tax=Clostridium neuense TaxID=1728934 RepID=A0ABW8TGQ3_9CLOT
MVEVIGITKQFKKVKAVDNISFNVNNGEIVGLLGENGAGKTTTLRMLATMLKISEGKAIINGYDASKEPYKVRGEIGILFGGDVGLYDRLTARENMMYFAKLNGMSDEEAKTSIANLSNQLEMQDYMDKRVGKFSRGMKQKVSIARSIVHNPSVVLFDEPTTGLDVSAARIVQDFILNCKKQNKAVVFSSHSMTEVEKLCDRVVIIHKGKLIEQGTIEELKEKYNNNDLEEVFVSLINRGEEYEG